MEIHLLALTMTERNGHAAVLEGFNDTKICIGAICIIMGKIWLWLGFIHELSLVAVR